MRSAVINASENLQKKRHAAQERSSPTRPGAPYHGKINVFGASLCDLPLRATVHDPPH